MLIVSFLWAPPLIWFAVALLALLLFTVRVPRPLLIGAAFTLVCVVLLAWPVNPLWQRIYSPYQVLEVGHNEESGLMQIRAAGHYYQQVFNLSPSNTDPNAASIRSYYDFPYKAAPALDNVVIVGAGTGNDVSAALRAGARHVDAIEIDPAILRAGRANHPERPYSDPRVSAVVNDARSFLRTASGSYDMIVYGLLDSHTLLSQGSSIRLDSFVYTIEGFREARSRLKPAGVLSLSYSVLSEALGRKIYLMLERVFDGRPPQCVKQAYDGSIIFMESNDSNWRLDPAVTAAGGFTDISSHYANPSIAADVSTDDWPFFYMPRRVYPASYLVMICQILLLSVFITSSFLGERPAAGQLSFLFLGSGFMLVETKAITELGLTFGNTWQVIGVVISGILTMAFLANLAVHWMNVTKPWVPYLLLWASLGLGWVAAGQGGFASTTLGRVEAAIVLTCPMFFSGMVFSTLLGSRGNMSMIMAMNLVGAVIGGLVEYNSMYFGFRSLYLIALAFYALAFVADLLFRPAPSGSKAGFSLRRTSVRPVAD
jgi:spermidine synthase